MAEMADVMYNVLYVSCRFGSMRGTKATFLLEMLSSLHVDGQVNLAPNSAAKSFRDPSFLSLVSV